MFYGCWFIQVNAHDEALRSSQHIFIREGDYIDRLVQDCGISSALEMEMPQYGTKPLICN